MGGWSNQIGHYAAFQMDYYYDHIAEEASIEYYNSETVQVTLKNLKTNIEEKINVPLNELHDFVKQENNDLYSLNWNTEGKSLRDWLWKKLKKDKIKIISAFELNVHLSNRDYWKECPNYYLNSNLLDNNIKISTNKVEFEVKSLEELDWLGKRGFQYA